MLWVQHEKFKKKKILNIKSFGEVAQGAAEGAPLQPLPHGVGVVQAGTVHTDVASLLLQA